MAEKKIIVGLDIGTTKIGLVVAERGQYGEVKILGVGTSPSHGLHRGVHLRRSLLFFSSCETLT